MSRFLVRGIFRVGFLERGGKFLVCTDEGDALAVVSDDAHRTHVYNDKSERVSQKPKHRKV